MAETNNPPAYQTGFRRAHRLRWPELLPWAFFVAFYFLFDTDLGLGTTILIMVLFTLSLDLVLGYAGIATLSHAAFFGLGAYTAGLLSVAGWSEPISGLVVAAAVAAVFGVISGLMLLHLHGNTLLMLTLALMVMLYEIANKWTSLTGGDDGLQGVSIDPIFGEFEFGLIGHTRYLYALAVLFVLFLVCRMIVHSQFGLALKGIRENQGRMKAIGSQVRRHLVVVYTISGAMAGVAGGLSAQSTEFVGLQVLSIALAATCLVMLILGGHGRLYGAIIGAALYSVIHDYAANWNPFHWMFVVGGVLILIVMFAKRGVLGLIEDASAWVERRTSRS